MARTETTRLSLTLPWAVLQRLQERADYQGRSLSSYAAHLLNKALSDNKEPGDG